MKNIFNPWKLWKHVIFSIAIFALTGLFVNGSASTGIIGGGDGPTAIFIAGNTSGESLFRIGIFVLVLVLYKPIKAVFER